MVNWCFPVPLEVLWFDIIIQSIHQRCELELASPHMITERNTHAYLLVYDIICVHAYLLVYYVL